MYSAFALNFATAAVATVLLVFVAGWDRPRGAALAGVFAFVALVLVVWPAIPKQGIVDYLRRRSYEHWRLPPREALARVDARAIVIGDMRDPVAASTLARAEARALHHSGDRFGPRYAMRLLRGFAQARQHVALLPIHPNHAEAIVSGRATIDIRKVRLRPNTTHVALYVTSPVKRVVAVAELALQVERDPVTIWRWGGRHTGITREEYAAYTAGRDRIVALEYRNIHSVAPMTVQACGVHRAPQCVQYLRRQHAAPLTHTTRKKAL